MALADFLAKILNPNPGTNRLVNPAVGGGNYLTQTGLGPEQMARYQQMSGMGGGGMAPAPQGGAAPPNMASQAPMMPPAQAAPQAPPMAAPAPIGGGGGILGGLRSLFGGGGGGMGEQQKINHTINWLTTEKGLDPGTAQALATNPKLLQDYLSDQMKGPGKRDTTTVDGKLIDAQTGEVIGDYGTPKLTAMQEREEAAARFDLKPGTEEYQRYMLTGDLPSNKDQDPSFKNEMDLRKEYDMLPEVKDYKVVRSNYERIRQGVTLGTGAGDAAIVFGYMKMLDPTSVVREGEQATTRNAAGVPEAVRGMYNQLVGGGQLSAEARTQILGAADRVYGESAKNIEDVNTRFGEVAKAWEVDPGRVISPTEKYDPVGNPAGEFSTVPEKGTTSPGSVTKGGVEPSSLPTTQVRPPTSPQTRGNVPITDWRDWVKK